jgi:hypothetical protein
MKDLTADLQGETTQMDQAVNQSSSLLKRLWQDRRVRVALMVGAIATAAFWVYSGMPMGWH